jgi:outer membrane lipoprotein-sorting protein
MVRGKSLKVVLMGLALCAMAMADTKTAPSKLTAEQIAQKNVAARGGLQAWRAVQAITYTGKMEAGGNHRPVMAPSATKRGVEVPRLQTTDQVQLPFTMDFKRPRKERLEIQFNGQTALQVYDGANGWKLRPYLNRKVVEPYSADEMKLASKQAELDGPLIDYATKGSKLELVGTDKVEGHDTYKLKLTPKVGDPFQIWIDSETFLEAKMEGNPRKLDGKMHQVEVYFRDYHTVNGLVIPYLIETRALDIKGVPGVKETSEKIHVEEVKVNPKLEDKLFTKPQVEQASTTAKQPPSPSGK